MLLHRFHSALIAIVDLLFVFLVEDGSDFAKVTVDLATRLCLLEREEVALIVGQHPGKDRIGTKIIEASRAKLVELQEQFLVLDLAFEPRVQQV